MAENTIPKVNYEDERFAKVEAEKNEALTQIGNTYDQMIGQTDKFYQAQIDASKEWADKQAQFQKEQTDLAVEQINQQKEQANKDYQKEQAGAYVDWQKQSNPYGTQAETMASAGLDKTGFSESAQVGMYNAYQNRVATAREAFSRAVLNYDNGIKEAKLQNSAALAEIHYQALQSQLELALNGFNYKNSLILEQANKKLEVENMYHNRYQEVLQQINQESALAEEIRQYNESLALQKEQFEEDKRQFNVLHSRSSGYSGGTSGGTVVTGDGDIAPIYDMTDKLVSSSANAVKDALTSSFSALFGSKGKATGNTKSFISNTMNSTEFARHNNKATIGGKSYTFSSYKDYLEASIDNALSSGKIDEKGATYLINYYGL